MTRIWCTFAVTVLTASPALAQTSTTPPATTYSPTTGFKLADTSQGDVNLRLFSYVRYLNQLDLDTLYTDAFGQHTNRRSTSGRAAPKGQPAVPGVDREPKLRYVAYVWTSNTSQGLGAQVVVGGNIQDPFNPHLRVGGGIGALPTSRSLEGSFPYRLPVDNRLIAEEFFRGSFTSGLWAKGRVLKRVDYQLMVGNNLSQLGVDAGQLDSSFDTLSTSLVWLPTTGEFGRGFGDYETA